MNFNKITIIQEFTKIIMDSRWTGVKCRTLKNVHVKKRKRFVTSLLKFRDVNRSNGIGIASPALTLEISSLPTSVPTPEFLDYHPPPHFPPPIEGHTGFYSS